HPLGAAGPGRARASGAGLGGVRRPARAGARPRRLRHAPAAARAAARPQGNGDAGVPHSGRALPHRSSAPTQYRIPAMTPRVLIVEDESLLVMVLEDLLPELGYEVVATAHSVETALQAADAHAPDLAILDINLAGDASFPIADELDRRGIPYLFASGYGRSALPPRHADALLVRKPFGRQDLVDGLARLPRRNAARA